MEESLVRYAHFLGILILASTLVVENVLLKPNTNTDVFKMLTRVDGLYGLGAIITLLAGLALWLWVGKPKAFYTQNPLFHIKLTLFGVIALLSLIPTVFFIRNRNVPGDEIVVPHRIIRIKRIELVMLSVMPLLAVFMARGFGLQ